MTETIATPISGVVELRGMEMLKLGLFTITLSALLGSGAFADDPSLEARQGIADLYSKIVTEDSETSTEEVPELFNSILDRGSLPVDAKDYERIVPAAKKEPEPAEPEPVDQHSFIKTPDVEVYMTNQSFLIEEAEDELTKSFDDWELKRTSDGTPILTSINDRSSAIEVVEGMVLGHLGRVRSIYEVDGHIEILFTNGEILQES